MTVHDSILLDKGNTMKRFNIIFSVRILLRCLRRCERFPVARKRRSSSFVSPESISQTELPMFVGNRYSADAAVDYHVSGAEKPRPHSMGNRDPESIKAITGSMRMISRPLSIQVR